MIKLIRSETKKVKLKLFIEVAVLFFFSKQALGTDVWVSLFSSLLVTNTWQRPQIEPGLMNGPHLPAGPGKVGYPPQRTFKKLLATCINLVTSLRLYEKWKLNELIGDKNRSRCSGWWRTFSSILSKKHHMNEYLLVKLCSILAKDFFQSCRKISGNKWCWDWASTINIFSCKVLEHVPDPPQTRRLKLQSGLLLNEAAFFRGSLASSHKLESPKSRFGYLAWIIAAVN